MYCNLKRDVLGNEPGSVGLIAKIPKKHPREKFIEEERVWRETMKNEKEIKDTFFKLEWVEESKKAHEKAEINRRIHELFCENSAHVKMRQERLRHLLQEDETKYYQELSDLQNTAVDKRCEFRKKANDMLRKKEAERIAFVQEKLEQQFRLNTEELRKDFYHKERDEIAREQRIQIQQKRDLAKLKLEEEKTFYRLWQADYDVKMKQDENEQLKNKKSQKEVTEHLLLQIAEAEKKKEEDRLNKLEELRLLENEKQLMEIEKMKFEEEKRRKRIEFKMEMEQSIADKRAAHEHELKMQMEFDLKLMKQIEQIKTDELKQIQKKKELRKEQENYLQYIHFLREDVLRQERLDEKFFKEEADMVWQKRVDAWKKDRDARQALIQEMIAERKQMIEEKFKRRFDKYGTMKEDKEKELKEVEMFEKMEKEEKRKVKEKNEKYSADLMCQLNYNRELYIAKQREEARMYEKMKEEEREYLAKVEDMKTRPSSVHVHPLRLKRLDVKLSAGSNNCAGKYLRSGTMN